VRVSRAAQRRAVDRLELRPGQRVLDVAFGTGLNFAAAERAIGPSGRLVGVDLSAAMLGQARRRVERHGWRNVELVRSSAQEANLGGVFDAALLSFAHDVLRSPEALDNNLRVLRPGARVASTGVMYPGDPLKALRPLIRWVSRGYVTTNEGLDRPGITWNSAWLTCGSSGC
jgi:ubiquinone/menaquinone biosynthesis C-methylase UbiE